MSSKNFNKKSDDKNDKAEQQALKEAEIVAELGPNEKTRKEAEKLIETVGNESTSIQEQEQQAIETVLDETKKNLEGIRTAILHVFGTNEKAIALYKSLGFVEVGRIKGGTLHKGEYIDELTMQLELWK